jgi:hypothetical protein
VLPFVLCVHSYYLCNHGDDEESSFVQVGEGGSNSLEMADVKKEEAESMTPYFHCIMVASRASRGSAVV